MIFYLFTQQTYKKTENTGNNFFNLDKLKINTKKKNYSLNRNALSLLCPLTDFCVIVKKN